MSRKNYSDEHGYYAPKKRKKNSPRDIAVMVAAIVVSVVLILLMVLNAPIINFKKLEGTTLTTQQVSIMKYWKLWQPLVDKEGTLAKVDSNDAALNLKSDLDSDVNDGLDLEQTIEGQYTILFLGMDESGELSDVDWVLQFDLIAGSMNILQIPRDSYMPDYASYSTTKFNSIYHSGQETGVTPIQRVVNAIQENFCIYVDAYVKLNCVDIANIVDSVGGIPITLPEQITYEADKILPAGEQTLNGQQSEWFVRFRHGYAEGDIGRVKAQRIFLAAAMEKTAKEAAEKELSDAGKRSLKDISYKDYDSIYQSSIHNGGKNKVMLGKYDGGGSTSYITKAGDEYTYFSLGKEWDSIKSKYGYTDDEMFKLFNEAFLDDGINAKKTFYFSHNPQNAKGALKDEYQYLLKNNYKWDSKTMTMRP